MKKKTSGATTAKNVKKKKKVSKSARPKTAKPLREKPAQPLAEKIFFKKMIENIFPQMTQQIMNRAQRIGRQIRRRGPKS